MIRSAGYEKANFLVNNTYIDGKCDTPRHCDDLNNSQYFIITDAPGPGDPKRLTPLATSKGLTVIAVASRVYFHKTAFIDNANCFLLLLFCKCRGLNPKTIDTVVLPNNNTQVNQSGNDVIFCRKILLFLI